MGLQKIEYFIDDQGEPNPIIIRLDKQDVVLNFTEAKRIMKRLKRLVDFNDKRMNLTWNHALDNNKNKEELGDKVKKLFEEFRLKPHGEL